MPALRRLARMDVDREERREQDLRARADHLGCHAVPLLDHLELDELRGLLERLALDLDRFGIGPGLDDQGLGVGLRRLHAEDDLLGLLLLHHLGLDGVLELLREADVLDHEILEYEQVADLGAGALEGGQLDLLSRLHDVGGRLQRQCGA
jgi:hypothetical protein